MLSIFPTLLTYQLFAPFLIRITLGAIFIYWGWTTFRKPVSTREKAVSIIEAVVGILFVIGFWTQIAALAAIIDLIIRLAGKVKAKAFLTNGVNYYLVLLVLAVSLLVSGAGFLAFDLPL